MGNQNKEIFNRYYQDIKDELSIYSCNYITNVSSAIDEIQNDTTQKTDYNRYDMNFIDKKLSILKRKISDNQHSVLQSDLDQALQQRDRINEITKNKRYLESKDVNLLNYYLIKLFACLNFDLNFEGFSPECIQMVYDSIYNSVIRGCFVDNYKQELVKGL